MKLVIPAMIFSFLFDGVLSGLLPFHNIFLPLFSIMIMVLIYPYFRGNKVRYLKYCFIFGIFFDFAYTDTFLMNAFIFSLVGVFVLFLNYWLTNNLLNSIVMGFLTILFYRFTSYIFYMIITSNSFSIFSLLESIYLSLISNLIYVGLFYLIMNKISKHFKIQRLL